MLDEFQMFLVDACTHYFGQHPSQVQPDMIKRVRNTIFRTYNDLTLDELKHCYERRPIDRQITVTYSDLLTPIQKYMNVREFVNKEKNRLIKEIRDEEEGQIRAAESLVESVKLYQECLSAGEWTGCVFRSMELARSQHLRNKLPEDVKQKFFEEAKAQEKNIKKIVDINPERAVEYMGYTWERIAAKKYVEECISRKIKI